MKKSEKGGWRTWLTERFGFASEALPPPYPKKKRYRQSKDEDPWPEDSLWFGDDHRTWHGRPRWEGLSDFKWVNHPCKKGEIGGPVRQKAIWQTEKTSDGKEHFYVTCPECAAVNDFTNHRIEKDGTVYPCIVCAKCNRHFWVQLEEWGGKVRKEHITADDYSWSRWFQRKYSGDGKEQARDRESRDMYESWW